MRVFIGRQRELSLLRRRYESGTFEFVGVYGRRRVGKTALIAQFTKELRSGWCAAVEDDAAMNLRILSQAVYALQHPDADPEAAPVFTDWRSAIEAAFAAARETRAVLVIDEFPYLAKACPSFPSILQAAIDAHQADSQLFLILCGSSLSFMKEQLLDKASPLYGRRTAQIELKPFDFFEAREFFPQMDPTQAAAIYGMVGGVPLYLRQFNPDATIEHNIESVFLDPGSILFEEPESLLRQEVSKAAPYNAVVSAVAGGAAQHNEIATKAGLESGALSYYLQELARLGLMEREEPITGRGGRKAIWRLSDNLFRFWYRFVRPRRPLIERGLTSGIATRIIAELPEFMGPVFEQMCRDWLWRELARGELSFGMTDVGRWWGNDPIARSEAEIDLVVIEGDETSMVGECKWRGQTMGSDQLDKLDRRAHLAGAGPATARWLFSKGGFTDELATRAADSHGVRLVTFEAMLA